MKPLFTIITVSFNSEKTIAKTIESVLNQTCQNYEYLIIDGASTDGTLDIVNKYIKNQSVPIKVLSEPDNGIYDAMNKGIMTASGEWLYFLNCDDTFYNDNVLNKFETVIDSAKNKLIVFGDYISQQQDGEEIINQNVSIDHKYLLRCMLCHQSMFIHKSVFADTGLYDCKYKIAADYNTLVKAYINKPDSFLYTSTVVARFIRGGFSDNNQALMTKERASVVKEHYAKHYPLFYKYLSTRKMTKKILNRLGLRK